MYFFAQLPDPRHDLPGVKLKHTCQIDQREDADAPIGVSGDQETASTLVLCADDQERNILNQRITR